MYVFVIVVFLIEGFWHAIIFMINVWMYIVQMWIYSSTMIIGMHKYEWMCIYEFINTCIHENEFSKHTIVAIECTCLLYCVCVYVYYPYIYIYAHVYAVYMHKCISFHFILELFWTCLNLFVVLMFTITFVFCWYIWTVVYSKRQLW